jgi:class 3 adenylate cyclase
VVIGGRSRSDAEAIRAWLRRLDLDHYVERFEAANIDLEVLPHLSEPDLREIGITALGHRRKILAHLPKAPQRQPADPNAEMRYLTVLFCDLVGSTQLAEILGAEAYWDLLVRYYAAIEAAVVPLGGYIAQHHGDGVLAYFGYPNPLEDAALRGVLGACRATKEVAKLAVLKDRSIAARVGVASGPVVVDRHLPSSEIQAGHAFGPTVNLAARLQSVARSGHVVASDTTAALIRHHFHARSLGKHRLKGIKSPCEVFEIEGERSRDLSVAITYQPVRVPFFGRMRELARLEEAWSGVRAGASQAILVTGEPGIGKSRLATEFIASVEGAGYSVRRIFCQPQSHNISFHAFHDALRFESHEHPSRPEGLLDAFTQGLGRSAAERRERRSELIRVLVDHFVAGDQPRIVWCDDIHWADPSSAEAISRLVARHAPGVLVLMGGRPEPIHSDEHLDIPESTERLLLEPLSPVETKQIIAHLLSGERAGRALLDTLANRSEGVPLFAEELALELRTSQNRRLKADPKAILPLSLQQSLQARIGRLTVARPLMRLMSCLGRRVSLSLLRSLWSDDNQIEEALEEITGAGLAEVRLAPVDGDENLLVCRHQLILDCAYDMILRRDRVVLHGRIADVLKQRATEGAAAHPLVHAEHLERAERLQDAAVLYAEAGRLAAAQSADAEAVSLYRRALDLARQMQAPRDDWYLQFEADTLLALHPAMVGASGYTVANTEVTTRLEELIPRLRGTDRLFSSFFIGWLDHLVQGDIDTAHGLTLGVSGAFAPDADSLQELMIHRMLGSTFMFRGELDEASAHLHSFLDKYRPDRHLPALNHFGATDNYITVLCCLAAVAAFTEDDESARQASQRAVSAAQSNGHIHTLCHTLCFGAALTAGLRGEWIELASHQRRLSVIAKKHQLPFWDCFALILEGISVAAKGDAARGSATFRTGRERLAAQGFHFMVPTFRLLLALACGDAAEVPDLEALEEELALGERWGLPLLAALRSGDHRGKHQ